MVTFGGSLLWELYGSNQYDPSANLVGQFMTWSKAGHVLQSEKM